MTIQIKRILLPTDFSTNSDAATKYACELAMSFDAELHLLHTIDIPYIPDVETGLDLSAYMNAMKADAKKSLAGLLDPKWVAGRKVIHAVIEGTPKVEIVRYAKQHDIDLIVISTHGRTGLAHVLMGSVAENVVRTAPCPVLTVRPVGHQFVMP